MQPSLNLRWRVYPSPNSLSQPGYEEKVEKVEICNRESILYFNFSLAAAAAAAALIQFIDSLESAVNPTLQS